VDPRFLFGIRLKEAVGALHRIYLNVGYQFEVFIRSLFSLSSANLCASRHLLEMLCRISICVAKVVNICSALQ